MSRYAYVDELDPDEQISAEEWIAAMIFDCGVDEVGSNEGPTEEAAAQLGRDILLEILARFRPDLVEEVPR